MKTFRHVLCAAFALVLLVGALPAWADPSAQAGAISYGQTVQGEITEDAIEQSWTFTGSAGDIITISVKSNDDNYLDSTLTLQDSAGAVIVEIDDVFGLDPFYITRLESDGEHTITVGRAGGADGSSVGGFDLTLAEAALTELGAAATLSLAEGQDSAFIAVQGDEAQKAVLEYELSAGDARPDLSIAYFAYDEFLEQVGYNELLSLTGETISKVSINLELPVTGIYMVIVERSWFDWGDTTGEFVVTVSSASE